MRQAMAPLLRNALPAFAAAADAMDLVGATTMEDGRQAMPILGLGHDLGSHAGRNGANYDPGSFS